MSVLGSPPPPPPPEWFLRSLNISGNSVITMLLAIGGSLLWKAYQDNRRAKEERRREAIEISNVLRAFRDMGRGG